MHIMKVIRDFVACLVDRCSQYLRHLVLRVTIGAYLAGDSPLMVGATRLLPRMIL
jgi:hypothetical protein